MTAEKMVGQDSPLMIAWNAHKATDEYVNSRKWAEHEKHLDGALWAMFCAGWNAAIAARDEELKRQEPPAWIQILKEAQELVDSKPVYKKFADGTPLLNDIPVWMADFAESYAAPIPPVTPTTAVKVAEPVKDDEWVQCYLYSLLDEAKRRGGMFPQSSDEQDEDSKAIFRVADMVRFYGQQGYPKQNAIAKLQALRERNRK